MVLTILLGLLICLMTSFLYVRFPTDYWTSRKFRSIKFEWPFGLMIGTVCLAEHVQVMYRKLKELGASGGGYFVLHLPIYHPISPDLVKSILVKDYHHFQSRGFFHTDLDPLSQHLVSLEGERWRKSRRVVSTTFTSYKLKRLVPKLTESTRELIDMIGRHRSIDFTDLVSRWVADNIASCIYGLDRECMKDPDSKLYLSGKRVGHQIFGNLIFNFVAIVFPDWFKYFGIRLTHRKDRDYLLERLKQEVDRRLDAGVSNGDFIGDYVEAVRNGREEFVFNEFASLVYTFFTAGFTSTHTSMTYALYELSINQNIQNKLRQEIQQLQGHFDYNSIMNLEYLDKVVNETLRKYPTTPFLVRQCNEPYRLPGTNQILDKGTTCWISALALHRDPDFYPEPDRFDPERFSQHPTSERHPFCYIPFGNGPRNCVGQRFALLQIKLGLVHLLSNYSFRIDPRTKTPIEYSSYSILLLPKHNIYLNVEKLPSKQDKYVQPIKQHRH